MASAKVNVDGMLLFEQPFARVGKPIYTLAFIDLDLCYTPGPLRELPQSLP
jgi:hypothetical protein